MADTKAPDSSTDRRSSARTRRPPAPGGRARQRALIAAAVPAGEDDHLAELRELLLTAGVDLTPPRGRIYVWAPVPAGFADAAAY
ncbi:MAG: hypothetical protein ACRDMX_18020 [Solirubrobacteraceae bacterium]